MYLVIADSTIQIMAEDDLSGYRDLDAVMDRTSSTEEVDGLCRFADKAKPGDIFRCPGLSVIRLGQEFGPVDGEELIDRLDEEELVDFAEDD